MLVIYCFQEYLIFHPDKLPQEHQFNLTNTTEREITVNGAKLSALHFKNKNPKGLVFFLHGNAGSLNNWLTDTSSYKKINYDLFIIDYRGFGKSTGKIKGEKELHQDILTAWNFIKPEYKGKNIIIYGRSIGTPLAAYLGSKIKADLNILVTPLHNLDELRKTFYPWTVSYTHLTLPTKA